MMNIFFLFSFFLLLSLKAHRPTVSPLPPFPHETYGLLSPLFFHPPPRRAA